MSMLEDILNYYYRIILLHIFSIYKVELRVAQSGEKGRKKRGADWREGGVETTEKGRRKEGVSWHRKIHQSYRWNGIDIFSEQPH